MPTRNINLTDALDAFVAEQVSSGAYQNASEVIRTALRLLKAEEAQRAAKLAALNAAIQEGLDSGPGEVIEDIDAYFDAIEAEVEAEFARTGPATAAE